MFSKFAHFIYYQYFNCINKNASEIGGTFLAF